MKCVTISNLIGFDALEEVSKVVVAGPAAVVAAMTVATRLRILIKSADFLEVASDVDTLILDKTGTVTVGAPVVTQISPVTGESEEALLAVAASCGFGSLHPVSRAVVAEALSRGIVSKPPKDLQEKPGLGVVAMVDGEQAVLGRRELLTDLGIPVGIKGDEDVSQVWVAHGGRCLGRFELRDRPRAEASEALASMRSLGINRLILLTGDRAKVAREVGDALGMDEVVAEVLPAQKLEVVRAEQSAGHVVMMVGDAVNDAPALGGADVGVAIGAELNEVALGGADVALLGTDLKRLPRLISLSALLAGVYFIVLVAHCGERTGGFSSLAAVVALFSNHWLLLAGWIHYLAFDLFVGSWEVQDAEERKISHWLMIPCLGLTFLFGPIGLLGYFAVRSAAGKLQAE